MNKDNIHPVIAAGGVVFRYTGQEELPEVLMIYRNGKWDLPKGKLEDGESIAMCAAREVAEETGSSLPAICADLKTTYHEYVEKGDLIGKTTYWYSMIFTRPESLSPQEEEGIMEVEWVPLEEALQRAGYDNLRAILQKMKT